MARMFGITEKEKKLVQSVLDHVRKQPLRQPTASDSHVDNEELSSPETYVALTPVTGIPPLVGIVPGSAKCDIYRVVGLAAAAELRAVPGLKRRVYNIGADAVPASTYVTVTRDKYGNWLPVLGGTGARMHRGILDGDLVYQGSAVMSIWKYNGTTEADTTVNVTVYDWHLMTGQYVLAGKQGTAWFDVPSGRWYFLGAQCPSV